MAWLSASLLVVLGAGAANDDWFASLYTPQGIEVRAHEGVFTLFAALNSAGYDSGEPARVQPFPAFRYSPLRQQVRGSVLGSKPELRSAINAYLDAHPAPMSRYVAYVLAQNAPGVEPSGFQDLHGLSGLLGQVRAQWGVDGLFRSTQSEYRKGLKSYLSALDSPFAEVRRLMQVPTEGGLDPVVVLNPLGAPGTVHAARAETAGFVVVAPSGDSTPVLAAREYARLLLEPAVRKVHSKWRHGAEVLQAAQRAGAPEQNVADYASAVLSRAVVVKAFGTSVALEEAYSGAREAATKVDAGVAPEVWALEALNMIQGSRPTQRR